MSTEKEVAVGTACASKDGTKRTVKKESMKKAARGEDWQGHGLQS